jgi:hypothetical protein
MRTEAPSNCRRSFGFMVFTLFHANKSTGVRDDANRETEVEVEDSGPVGWNVE